MTLYQTHDFVNPEIQKICETLKPMGKFKVFGDAHEEKLSFVPTKPYATQESINQVLDLLRKIGFTNVWQEPKKNLYHCVYAQIVCKYDLATKTITNASVPDVRALCGMFNYMKVWCFIFLSNDSNREPLPFWQHKSNLQNYLLEKDNHR